MIRNTANTAIPRAKTVLGARAVRPWLLGGMAIASLTAGPAFAQSDTTTPAPAKAAEPTIQDIVVTATRREANLQKVAATIDVVSGKKLDALNIKGVEGLSQLVPGLTTQRAGGMNAYIRGIGVGGSGYSNESPIAYYVDGIYLPNQAGALFSFNNINRIEVLKGPQGTLYGRNTTGGLINVITRDPGTKPAVDASLSYGNYNTFAQNFYGSTPLTDTLSANVAVFHSKQGDGYGRNLYTGDQTLKGEETGIYGKMQWKPGPNTRVLASGLYDFDNTDKGIVYALVPGTLGNDGSASLGKYQSSTRTDPTSVYHGYTGSLKVEQTLPFATFSNLLAYQTSHQLQTYVQNGIAGQPVAGRSANQVGLYGRNSTWSDEPQLSSNAPGAKVTWILGAFIYHDNTEVRQDTAFTCVGATCAPGTPSRLTGYASTRSYSGYGDATYQIFEHTHVTAGLRYTYEQKGLAGTTEPLQGLPDSVAALPATTVFSPGQPFAGNPDGIATERNYSKLTYRGVLAQDIGGAVHTYFSYNLGFRSGTYSVVGFTNPPTKPETLSAYEVGVKSELFDRHLRLNLSGFYYNYTDIQVRSIAGLAIGAAPVLSNAASAHAKGIDAQFDWVPVRGLTINGGLEYLEAHYADYPGATCTRPATVTGTVLGGVTSFTCDLSGHPLPISPKLAANLGIAYEIVTQAGSIVLNANDSFKSRYNFTLDDAIQQKPTHIADASLTWRPTSRRYDVQFFVKNLTNSYYYVGALTSTTATYRPGAPRTYGVTLGFHL